MTCSYCRHYCFTPYADCPVCGTAYDVTPMKLLADPAKCSKIHICLRCGHDARCWTYVHTCPWEAEDEPAMICDICIWENPHLCSSMSILDVRSPYDGADDDEATYTISPSEVEERAKERSVFLLPSYT